MYLLTCLSTLNNLPFLTAPKLYNRSITKKRFEVCREIFEAIHFPYAIIKGAVLSQTIYNDPFIRLSNDIDILINRNYADDLKKILLSHGFVQSRIINNQIVPFTREEILFQSTFTHQMAPYIRPLPNKASAFVNLDVNIDIFWGESNTKASMDYVLSQTIDYKLFDICFKKLSVEMEFVQLCMHHYKDMNSLFLLSTRGLI